MHPSRFSALKTFTSRQKFHISSATQTEQFTCNTNSQSSSLHQAHNHQCFCALFSLNTSILEIGNTVILAITTVACNDAIVCSHTHRLMMVNTLPATLFPQPINVAICHYRPIRRSILELDTLEHCNALTPFTLIVSRDFFHRNSSRQWHSSFSRLHLEKLVERCHLHLGIGREKTDNAQQWRRDLSMVPKKKNAKHGDGISRQVAHREDDNLKLQNENIQEKE